MSDMENKELQKLFEDYDKLGITPHRIMGLDKLFPGKGLVTTAAGLAALAAAGLGKGAMFLGKQAFMKRGFLKVLKQIGDMENYIIDGDNPEEFRYMSRLKNGGKITTIKHYDEIKEKVLDEIRKDIKEFEDFKNSYNSGTTQYNLNDKGTLVYIINKYHKFFITTNKSFEQIKSSNNEEDIYNSLQKTINENLTSSDKYINTLITKFKTRFTIGKEENPGQNKRLDKYVDALNQSWNTVKEEIIQKYKKLAIDICRSAEFTTLYKLVEKLYRKLPNGKLAAKQVLQNWKNIINRIQKTIHLKYSIDPSNTALIKFNLQDNSKILDLIKNSSFWDDAVNNYNKANKTSYSIDNKVFSIIILDNNRREIGEFNKTNDINIMERNVSSIIKSVDDIWMNSHVKIKCSIKLGNSYGEYGGQGSIIIENVDWKI